MPSTGAAVGPSAARQAFTAACLAVLAGAIVFSALRLVRPATGEQVSRVYRVGAIAALVRVGAAPSAPLLGEVTAEAFVALQDDERALDGWIHVRGRNWQGWVAPGDVQGPYQRSLPVSALAALDQVPEL